MKNKCCIRGCSSIRQDVLLHRFPIVNKKRLHMWLKCVKDDDLECLSLDQLKNHHVCHKHFEQRFITHTGRLLSKAYPTLFTHDEISSGIPRESHIDAKNLAPDDLHNYIMKIHSDHNYCKPPVREEVSILKEISANVICTPSAIEPIPSTSAAVIAVHITSDNEPVVSNEPIPSTSAAVIAEPTAAKISIASHKKKWVATNTSDGKNESGGDVRGLCNMSPVCKLMYKKYSKAKKQNSNLKRALSALLRHLKKYKRYESIC